MKTCLITCIIAFLLFGCKKEEDFIKTLPSCSPGVLFTHSPVPLDDVIRFVPLGHYKPSSHTFPTSHHYIDVTRGEGSIPIYAMCDGWIVSVTEFSELPPVNKLYALEFWACKDVLVTYRHVPLLENTIQSQLTKIIKSESYTTGGQTYHYKTYETRIRVNAGDKIGELPDMDEVIGLELESIDKRARLPFVNPERWGGYNYINTISFLNLATPEIKNAYHEVVKYNQGGYLHRTTPPLEGQVCYDIKGTVQGLWFLPGKDVYPEDPHLALILNYYYPQKNVFSVGTSVPGLPVLAYEFYPEESGTHNRSFDKITADGNIYSFSDFYNIWDEPITDYTFPTENVILIQLTDLETLRIEKQTKNDGPPFSFKNNYVDFKR
jgi:hypothetical protein